MSSLAVPHRKLPVRIRAHTMLFRLVRLAALPVLSRGDGGRGGWPGICPTDHRRIRVALPNATDDGRFLCAKPLVSVGPVQRGCGRAHYYRRREQHP